MTLDDVSTEIMLMPAPFCWRSALHLSTQLSPYVISHLADLSKIYIHACYSGVLAENI